MDVDETYKISVVIPAYNAEKTIERTIRSVLSSTIPIEVWAVDDGSTDSTGRILDDLAATLNSQPTTLTVIHQENCGAYQARLNALKQIKTPYFCFVDADDTIEPDMYEKMVAYAETNNLDVAQCGMYGDNRLDGSRRVLTDINAVMSGYVLPILIEGRTSSFIWDKVYRNQYDFNCFDATDHVTMFDDLIFNLQFFKLVRRMGIINEPLYHYDVNAGSSVRNFKLKNLADFRETVRVRNEWLPKYGFAADDPVNRAWIAKNMRNMLISASAAPSKSWTERIEKVKAVITAPEFPFKKLCVVPVPILAAVIYMLKKIHG